MKLSGCFWCGTMLAAALLPTARSDQTGCRLMTMDAFKDWVHQRIPSTECKDAVNKGHTTYTCGTESDDRYWIRFRVTGSNVNVIKGNVPGTPPLGEVLVIHSSGDTTLCEYNTQIGSDTVKNPNINRLEDMEIVKQWLDGKACKSMVHDDYVQALETMFAGYCSPPKPTADNGETKDCMDPTAQNFRVEYVYKKEGSNNVPVTLKLNEDDNCVETLDLSNCDYGIDLGFVDSVSDCQRPDRSHYEEGRPDPTFYSQMQFIQHKLGGDGTTPSGEDDKETGGGDGTTPSGEDDKETGGGDGTTPSGEGDKETGGGDGTTPSGEDDKETGGGDGTAPSGGTKTAHEKKLTEAQYALIDKPFEYCQNQEGPFTDPNKVDPAKTEYTCDEVAALLPAEMVPVCDSRAARKHCNTVCNRRKCDCANYNGIINKALDGMVLGKYSHCSEITRLGSVERYNYCRGPIARLCPGSCRQKCRDRALGPNA